MCFEDGIAAKPSPDVRLDNERVGFALTDAKFSDVVLDVALGVIVMVRIIELSAARCFQIVDPREIVFIDEIGVQAKSD